MSSFFDKTSLLPDDPILSLPVAYEADNRPNKVNLGIGAYRDSDGAPLILTSVKQAETLLLSRNLNKEYLPIGGDPVFIEESLRLVFGEAFRDQQVVGIQTLGGTGALRLGAEFLAQQIKTPAFLSDPSWPNHRPIFAKAGLKIESYPYYHYLDHRLDFENMCAAIQSMPEESIVVLQASCHNPTGVDPTPEQWKELSSLMKEKHLIPFFDLAYQGFGDDMEKDAQGIRIFASQGHEMFIAISYSKNFGLYGERVGLLSIVSKEAEIAKKIESNIKQIIRGIYSNPPLHGERLVATILQSPELKKNWLAEVKNMRSRVVEMRHAFVSGLLSKGPLDFNFMSHHKGLFSFCGFDDDQIKQLRQEFAIYMPPGGRLNIAGLNWHNMDHVIEAFLSVSSCLK